LYRTKHHQQQHQRALEDVTKNQTSIDQEEASATTASTTTKEMAGESKSQNHSRSNSESVAQQYPNNNNSDADHLNHLTEDAQMIACTFEKKPSTIATSAAASTANGNIQDRQDDEQSKTMVNGGESSTGQATSSNQKQQQNASNNEKNQRIIKSNESGSQVSSLLTNGNSNHDRESSTTTTGATPSSQQSSTKNNTNSQHQRSSSNWPTSMDEECERIHRVTINPNATTAAQDSNGGHSQQQHSNYNNGHHYYPQKTAGGYKSATNPGADRRNSNDHSLTNSSSASHNAYNATKTGLRQHGGGGNLKHQSSRQHFAQQNLRAGGDYQNANNNNSHIQTNLHQNHQQPQDYKNSESPNSTNSEGSNDSGSQDSGRATGGLTSTSPFDINDADVPMSMYEFEIPNTLVGLIIGVGGKTIMELCKRAEVKMLIRPHHTPSKMESHQICSVEGRREHINKCLHMIKGRFPRERFPDLNLKPVLPPPIDAVNPTLVGQARSQTIPLTMPIGVPCEVYVSASVDAGHFFVQLPTHPSFSSLQLLDCYMLNVYGQSSGVPELPKPCNPGILCAAPAYNGWFRAITLLYDAELDETLVRFVDYGGFAKIPRADLRQIRTDFLTLPLQAIECYLANVQPIDGTSHWSDEANDLFQKLCAAKIIQAQLVGHNKTDGIPCVELHIVDENKKVLRVDQVLLEKGLAKPADPTRILPLKESIAAVTGSSNSSNNNTTAGATATTAGGK
jgi:hypothetical protein